MKKQESKKQEDKERGIYIKNISGFSEQYIRNTKENFMNEILQGCAEIDKKEQMEREAQRNYQKNKEFASGIIKDVRKLDKKYTEQDDLVVVDENNSANGGSIA